MKVLFLGAGVLIGGLGAAYFAGALDPTLRMAEGAAVDAPETSEQSATDQPSQNEIVSATGSADQERSQEEEQQQFQGLIPGGSSNVNVSEAAPEGEGEGDAEPGGNAENSEVAVPTFDLLRVEPDGSMVIAGKAAADAEVQVLNGSSVLATTETGMSGDFAAVLDEPLKPGDYNIVLRGTSPESVVTSVETAIVSIPSNESGQVVALVQEPGVPSRLITVPQAEPAEAPDGTDKQEAAEISGPMNPPDAETDGDEGAGDETEGGPADRVNNEVPSEAETAGEDEASSLAARSDLPDTTDNVDDQAASGPTDEELSPDIEAREDSGTSPEANQEAASESQTEASPEARQDVAEARDGNDSAGFEASASEAADASPFIEAVEIDGRQVFVAGRAKPGHRVRVYINDILLGQTDATPDGTFLIEAERDLPAGDYIVRADVLDSDGSEVIARAAVPFERPAGDHFAAVAGEGGAEQASDEARNEADDESAVSRPGNDEIPERLVRSRPGESMDRTEEDDSSMEGGGAVFPPSTPRDETREVVMPPLEPTDGSVIIRRGDTLWHISRRVYGQGVRYSTIYLANQEQIRDPDLIYPGQIFSVPDSTDEGEAANFDAIQDQALSPDEAAAEVDS
ncbi:LysM peptidoglycan-binding domain-containing protein [Chelativorans sp. YIM 93263]|uniref:LysM peptidoglycan-binding domain-containing protein n=1 Tax=Chelativorans sp. YIM 93263 TaxID=2906648 RepID=UPI0023780DC9|nr:LysM peptidoglycan-binding domain-containing protein [Chelativorans sp. YIM 93263]